MAATVLAEACGDLRIEPLLQPPRGETLRFATANRKDEACVDVAATGFWRCKHEAFLVLKCLMLMPPHTVVHRYRHSIENLNVRSRGSMNNVLERWRWARLPLFCFPHLVVAMGHASTVFYKRLAFLVSLKRGVSYSSVMSWFSCRISYSFAIMHLRGTRSHQSWPLFLWST